MKQNEDARGHKWIQQGGEKEKYKPSYKRAWLYRCEQCSAWLGEAHSGTTTIKDPPIICGEEEN